MTAVSVRLRSGADVHAAVDLVELGLRRNGWTVEAVRVVDVYDDGDLVRDLVVEASAGWVRFRDREREFLRRAVWSALAGEAAA